MASIGTERNGHRRILFVAPDGSRKTVRLGKCSQRDAEQVCRHVEALLAAKLNNQNVERPTAVWLSGISNILHKRMARAELVIPRADIYGTKLGAFLDAYIASRSDLKPGTVTALQQTRRELVAYFDEGRSMSSITQGDADAFRATLAAKGWAENTIRRTCGRARQFFRAAKRRELVEQNPFDGIKCAVGANPDRMHFVSRDVAQKVLNACPDVEWRLIFALCRFGGLRCPSEVLALSWSDVNWEHNRIRVPSPKTAHHVGGESRLIPLFPELRPHLLEAFDQAEPGAMNVITRYRQKNSNLRTQLSRIIRKAGLEPWPRLLHNLRSTRETELAEQYPMHVVCRWIGNSQPVAAKHYLQLTDEHFERAVAGAPLAAAAKPAQNPAQQVHAAPGKTSHGGIHKRKNPAI